MEFSETFNYDRLCMLISAVVAVAAVISPILVAVINNIHQSGIKEQEAKQKLYEDTVVYKRNIFENYIRCAGRSIKSTGWNENHDYKEAYFYALLYAPDDLRSKMIEANEKRNSPDGEKAFEALIPEICIYIDTLKVPHKRKVNKHRRAKTK